MIAGGFAWSIPVVILLTLLIAGSESLGAALVVPLLMVLTGEHSVVHGDILSRLLLVGGQQASVTSQVQLIAAAIAVCVVAKCSLQIVSNVFSSWVDGKVGWQLRSSLAERLTTQPFQFFVTTDHARLINILTTVSWRISAAFRTALARVSAMTSATIFAGCLLWLDWRLAALVAVGGLTARLLQRRVEAALERASKVIAATNERLAERMLLIIHSARLIRLFGKEAAEHRTFDETSDAVRRSILRLELMSGGLWPTMEALHGLLFLAMLPLALVYHVSLPVLGAFLVLLNRLQPSLRTLEQSSASMASIAGELSDLEWLLQRTPQIDQGGRRPFPRNFRTIAFEDVTFSYSGREAAPALEHVSFAMRSGRMTAIAGPSGAGKSTIINLLCLLIDPAEGRVRVDGEDLRQFDRSAWLGAIGVAGQDIDLVPGTIADNIAWGADGVSRAAIERAARLAKLDFVEQLPNGLDTSVGTDGAALSGGQRQRVGLARALVREPAILILDEATNAVDHATEQAIFQTVRELTAPRVKIVISHRASVISQCDDVVMLGEPTDAEDAPAVSSDALRAAAQR
jgi:ABC-type multidrug transport system fused ATPase/permease subunit